MSMESSRARMFNRKASVPESRPDQVLESLHILPGQKIADIGAGGGYFAFRMARLAGREGMVFAADTNPDLLDAIRSEAERTSFSSIKTVLISPDGGTEELPKAGLDMIFMRNVYHHIKDRAGYFRVIGGYLKPEGRIAIIEHARPGRLSFAGLFGHNTDPKTIAGELEQAGFRAEKTFGFLLPKSSFTVFSKKE